VVKGEESLFFIIGQEARDLSSTILRQSGVKYRGIPPTLSPSAMRRFFSEGSHSNKHQSLWPSSALAVGS